MTLTVEDELARLGATAKRFAYAHNRLTKFNKRFQKIDPARPPKQVDKLLNQYGQLHLAMQKALGFLCQAAVNYEEWSRKNAKRKKERR